MEAIGQLMCHEYYQIAVYITTGQVSLISVHLTGT